MLVLFFIGVFVFIGWYLISAFNTTDSSSKLNQNPVIKVADLNSRMPDTKNDSTAFIELKEQTEEERRIWISTWKQTAKNAKEKSEENNYLKRVVDSIMNNDMASDYYFIPAKN